ncbi:autotransporter outer membrane beta-barrel domain-containing protein, partial [Snodgrassella sp. CFCC 13594]|uniref:autotransporter outer membrane beta-barrel domain-containing protein n=1 Tax=Snodgrassella sp. CFCC 13594 TaxID=1775559 RepID=UPI000A8480F5
NTVWNTDSSTSDKLVINGDASGSTTVSTPNGIIGNVVQTNAQIYSADVVTIAGTDSSDTTFTGSAQTTNAGEAQLVKKDANTYAWTLYAKSSDDDNSGGT